MAEEVKTYVRRSSEIEAQGRSFLPSAPLTSPCGKYIRIDVGSPQAEATPRPGLA